MREPHPEPAACWEMLTQWIAEKVQTPESEPLSPAAVQVLLIGAFIGARFSRMFPQFGHAICVQGNLLDSPVLRTIRTALITDYVRALRDDMDALAYNKGFSDILTRAMTTEEKAAFTEAGAGITEADKTDIMSGLDELFGNGKEPA